LRRFTITVRARAFLLLRKANAAFKIAARQADALTLHNLELGRRARDRETYMLSGLQS
jgi:hypothetical protein